MMSTNQHVVSRMFFSLYKSTVVYSQETNFQICCLCAQSNLTIYSMWTEEAFYLFGLPAGATAGQWTGNQSAGSDTVAPTPNKRAAGPSHQHCKPHKFIFNILVNFSRCLVTELCWYFPTTILMQCNLGQKLCALENFYDIGKLLLIWRLILLLWNEILHGCAPNYPK